MKTLKTSGRLFIGLSMLFWALFQFTKDNWRWPAYIADKILYITLFLIAIGYTLLCIHYIQTKNTKKAWELVIIAAVILGFFLLMKLLL